MTQKETDMRPFAVIVEFSGQQDRKERLLLLEEQLERCLHHVSVMEHCWVVVVRNSMGAYDIQTMLGQGLSDDDKLFVIPLHFGGWSSKGGPNLSNWLGRIGIVV